MRKLLVILALVGLTCVVGAWQPPAAGSTSYFITAMILHPTGGGSYKAILTCGWHDVGDCICPDTYSKGLDWVAQSGSTQVSVRIAAYGGPSATTRVANMSSSMPQYGCKRIVSQVKRLSDGGLFGSVVNQHSYREGTYSTVIYSQLSGFQNIRDVGFMVPAGQDNCTTEGPHTMQWYESGNYDTEYGKDTGIPTECQCCGCNKLYDPWLFYEYYFKFYS